MTTIAKPPNRYSLEFIEQLKFNGFDYVVPNVVMEKISNLAIQVGSPDYVKTPVFKKRENPLKVEPNTVNTNRKRRGNKGSEINDEDWNTIRNFQTTKIEASTGLNAELVTIRGLINKITDKNYTDMCNKIAEVIEKMTTEYDVNDLSVISSNIFEIASSNRYYSKIYADLYVDLSSKFDFIKTKYKDHFNKFADLFETIEYVDPNENYDRFCEINKINEKRKSLASFYINLMYNNIISKEDIISITKKLLGKVCEFILLENKKNEVEEITETIGILYKKEMYNNIDDDDDDLYAIDIQNSSQNMSQTYTIKEVVEKIANSKVKDYKSLTTKSLFKFMELVDM